MSRLTRKRCSRSHFEGLPVGGEGETLGDPDLVAPDREGPFGGERGIELADGAGGGVAGVHEGGEPLLGAALVERGEVLEGHVQLTSNLEEGGRVGDVQRNGGDGAEVVGDVLADLTVPAGGAALEHAVAVDQADGEPVDLGLDDVLEAGLGDALAGEVVAHPLDPRAQLGLGAGVAEGEHRLEVGDLLQAPHGLGADALGGRVGAEQLGVRGLQRPELLEQRVILVVPDDGVVERVVAVGVVLDLAAQSGDALGGIAHLNWPPPRRRRGGRAGRSPRAPPSRVGR